MTPEQHARAKELFLAACERPAEGRVAFLNEACRDEPALRAHVEELLRHHLEDEGPAPAAASESRRRSDSGEQARFQAGTVIAERYRIIRLLGRGGMGEVLQADDLVMRQEVALKFLPDALRRSPRHVRQLLSEARIARTITNPHVCRIHDIHVDQPDGELFISMEFIDGENLSSLIRRIGRIPQEKALEIARQVCVALAAAHDRGVLHRDLKPANIMIDERGQARVTDFGLAAPLEQIGAEAALEGTPAYMAPELFAGTRASVQSDLYALGLVLYELLTGQPAFRADSFSEYANVHQRGRPTPPTELVPSIAPELDRLIQQCLEKDPHDRPASALAVAAALPGGDPLALALAAGVTPSPALVAASRAGGERLRSGGAAGLLACAAGALILIVLLLGPSGLTLNLRDAKPAGILAERARQLASELGRGAAPRDRAFGLSLEVEADFFPAAQRPHQPSPRFARERSMTPRFWYRESSTSLAPASLAPASSLNITFGEACTSLGDPPRVQPGMVTLVLDPQGALLAFEAPPPYEPGTDGAAIDWSPFFAAAGLEPKRLSSVVPRLAAWLPVDERRAWEWSAADDSTHRVRIEAAAFRGRPVVFAVLRGDWPAASAPGYADREVRRGVALHTRFGLFALAAIAALPLAWRHLRQGRGDRVGALRLCIVVFIARLVTWVLQAKHSGEVDQELHLLVFAVMRAWFEAGLVWLFYTALEPHVRRFWPQTIVAWSRLLGGRPRDSLVARDVLAGTLLGLCIMLCFQLDRIVPGLLGLSVREPLRFFFPLEPLLGVWQGLATTLSTLLASIYLALFLVTSLVIMRLLLRRTWLAGAVMVTATAPMFLPGMANPASSWLPITLILATVFWAAARFGLVMIICAIFVTRLLVQLPLSFVPGTPGWDIATFALLVICGLALFGFAHARRGEAMKRAPTDDTAASAAAGR